jgi:small subunit ribosomal protein S9
MEIINTIGRRKTAVARIYVKQGQGNITVNKRDLGQHFPTEVLQTIVQQPLALCEQLGKYDIKVNVRGGGISGQAEAVRHAISRALVKINAEEFRSTLKAEGFMTRDPRMVERKKYGRRKARRKFQFSKR